MARGNATEWHRSVNMQGSSKYESRKELIARAARICFGRKGVAKTSIADITREVDITRELFYYYFPNKASVVDAVMDSYVADADKLFEHCLEETTDVDIMLLRRVVGCLRSWLSTDGDQPFPMLELLREASRFSSVTNLVVDRVLEQLQNTQLRLGEGPEELEFWQGRKMGLLGVILFLLDDDQATDDQVARALLPLFS